ncbi:phage virion morphogenesis protein [Shewanella algae]|uniref:phage virion morphogenesis protein n=1 Tax=Shewanella algae TaxID=38313 RepID=UPI0034D73E96
MKLCLYGLAISCSSSCYTWQTTNGLELGSNIVYAAIQQFGGTTSPNNMISGKEIPAHEFLGLSDEDETILMEEYIQF